MKYNDIEDLVLNSFHSKIENVPEHRYASFDYCYNYFNNSSHQQLKNDIEKACLHLGFYLASWGILRGSSFLLQKNIKHYKPLIEYFIRLKKDNHIIWDIDVDKYTDENIDIILNIYKNIQKYIIDKNSTRHIVLVSKIMLGVFGCVPAYDQYFTKTFRELFRNKSGFRSLNKKSLLCIKEFYEENIEVFNKLKKQITTVNFADNELHSNNYTIAKIIDMYGFTKSIK